MQIIRAHKTSDGLIFEEEQKAQEHEVFQEILLILAPEKMHQDVALRQRLENILKDPARILNVLKPLCSLSGTGLYVNKYTSTFDKSQEEPTK